MPPKRGLFLDLDGTLADSLAALRQVYERFLEQHGCAGSVAEFASLNGPSVPEIVTHLKRRHSLTESAPVLLKRYEQLVWDAYKHIPAMPGASRLLAAADARGWAVSIVTSNGSELARRWLEETELKKYVVSVVGQEMVSQAKPAPDLYLYALALSGCCREGSIAVEDSPVGALAALGAGIRTCFVGAPPEALTGASLNYIEDLSVLAQWLADGTIDLHNRCASR